MAPSMDSQEKVAMSEGLTRHQSNGWGGIQEANKESRQGGRSGQFRAAQIRRRNKGGKDPLGAAVQKAGSLLSRPASSGAGGCSQSSSSGRP